MNGPNDTAVAVGSTASFVCTSNHRSSMICWDFEPQHPASAEPIQNKSIGCFSPKSGMRYDVQRIDNKSSSLTWKAVQMADAGFYSCWERMEGERNTAQLIVVGGLY